jgi:very-short-patch-repair endonuclease
VRAFFLSQVDPKLLQFARQMRKDPAPAEKKLWQCLRDRQLNAFKFRRQHVIGKFIADFYGHEADVIIELDGESHGHRTEYDSSRTRILERDGSLVIRFVNEDVFDFLDCVLNEILQQCEARVDRKQALTPTLSRSTGRGGNAE